MQEIQYGAPTSIEDAMHLLAGGDARVLGGGTDLLIQLRQGGLPSVRLLVDVKRIPELSALEAGDRGLRLGAAVPCARLGGAAEVASRFPGLVEAARLIGSAQIQSRASVGGNLCNGSPAADTTPALIALGARARVAGPRGRREIPVEDFVTGPRRNAMTDGELLVDLWIDAPVRGSADCYMRFTPRNEMDIAVVGVGASVTIEDGRCVAARVALGAVAATPILAPGAAEALVGGPIDDEALGRAAAAAMAVADPISDKRGPAHYRRRLVGVLTRRTVAEAARRAVAAH